MLSRWNCEPDRYPAHSSEAAVSLWGAAEWGAEKIPVVIPVAACLVLNFANVSKFKCKQAEACSTGTYSEAGSQKTA
jgi:hypothetical protein